MRVNKIVVEAKLKALLDLKDRLAVESTQIKRAIRDCKVAITEEKRTLKSAMKPKSVKNIKHRKPSTQFMVKLKPSAELAVIIGNKAQPRSVVVKKIWDYIRENKLQNPKNKRNVFADGKLLPIFKQEEVTMFELAGMIGKHLTPVKE